MTIKRKTQLNLSGSHRNVDADIAWVGSNLYVTGSSQFTGSAYFQQITGSISGTLGGLPFIVAGPNITASYNDSTGQWAITGSSGGTATPAGADRTVQFNNNGAFAGDVDFQFYSNSLGNIGANTLAFPSGNVGVLSGSNIDNQAYTLVLSAAVASIPVENGGPFPGVFDPAMVVLTPVLMSQSLMLFDGRHDPLGLGDNNVPGGGLVLANDAQFTLYSGSWNPLPSDYSGGKDPLVSIFNQGERGIISVVGQLMVQSSSTDQNNIFQVGASDTAGQVQLTNVGTADFISGAVRLTYGSEFTVFSGSGGTAQFTVYPSFTSGKVDASLNGAMTITSGSLYVNSGSSFDSSFQIEPSATAGQVNVIFDRTGSTGGVNFQGINVRPLYSSMTTSGSAGTEMSGSLLLGTSGPNSVGKIDFNVTAVQKDTNNYGSWTFSTTVARDTAGATSVIAYSELDAATSGNDAAAWDVNINSNAVIYCTGSAGAEIQWYAHVTKKMFLSGSGLITY